MCLQVFSFMDSSGNGGDFSATKIHSDNPVVVITGKSICLMILKLLHVSFNIKQGQTVFWSPSASAKPSETRVVH